MKYLISLCTIVTSTLLFSCERTYHIPPADLNLIPYEGNEVLIFKSSAGNMDTVILQGINRFHSWTNQWAIFPKNAEYAVLESKRTDPKHPNRHLDSLGFMSLVYDGETTFKINFTAKNAWFYGDGKYSKDQILNAKTRILSVQNISYNDVLVITPKWEHPEMESLSSDRKDFITKIYWSKTHGLVRYEILNGEYWELDKIIHS